jgi:hypothetical protein
MKRACLMLGIVLNAVAGRTTPLCAQTLTALPGPSRLPFSLAQIVPSTTAGRFTIQEYRTLDGSADGSVTPFVRPVFDGGSSSAQSGDNPIGTVRWEFALFRGSSAGAAGPIDGVGAALMGGFQETASIPAGTHLGFLQVFTDSFGTGVDGGGPHGKVNGDIPDWNRNPGWNFDGDRTRFDYFDIPFDSTTLAAETVSFETALAAWSGSSVLILDDVTWRFNANADNPGDLAGMAPTERLGGASNRLLGLYRNTFPSVTYLNIGQGTLSDLPEPSLELAVAIFAVIASRRLRLRRRA